MRDDGYHDLTTVFHALSLTDEVTVFSTPDAGIEVSGEGAKLVPTDDSNLAMRAVRALAEHVGSGEEELAAAFARRSTAEWEALAAERDLPVAGLRTPSTDA